MNITNDTYYWFFSTIAQCDIALIAFFSVIFFYALQYFEKVENDYFDEIGRGLLFNYNFVIPELKSATEKLFRLIEINRKRVFENESSIIRSIVKKTLPYGYLPSDYQDEIKNKLFDSYELIKKFAYGEYVKYPPLIGDIEQQRLFDNVCKDIKHKIELFQEAKKLKNDVPVLKSTFVVLLLASFIQFAFSIFGILFVESEPNSVFSAMPMLLLVLIVVVMFVILGIMGRFFCLALKMVK